MLFHSPRSLPMTVPPSTSFHQDGFFVAKLKKTSNKVPATERKGCWIRGLQEQCFWHCLMVWGQKESRRIDPKWKTKCGARTDLTATAFGFARARAHTSKSGALDLRLHGFGGGFRGVVTCCDFDSTIIFIWQATTNHESASRGRRPMATPQCSP